MTIPVPRGNNADEGAYAAVIAGIWPVGNQLKEYENVKSVKACLCIAIELDGEMAGWIGEANNRQHVLFDEVAMPMFWPGKRNSNLYSYASAAMGSSVADSLEDFETMIGMGVQVGVKHSNGKARIRTVSALMKGTATPAITGNHSEPWGLASYLLGKSVTDAEAVRLRQLYADEAEAKRQAEEAASFAAPTRGADDIPPGASDPQPHNGFKEGGPDVNTQGGDVPPSDDIPF